MSSWIIITYVAVNLRTFFVPGLDFCSYNNYANIQGLAKDTKCIYRIDIW